MQQKIEINNLPFFETFKLHGGFVCLYFTNHFPHFNLKDPEVGNRSDQLISTLGISYLAIFQQLSVIKCITAVEIDNALNNKVFETDLISLFFHPLRNITLTL